MTPARPVDPQALDVRRPFTRADAIAAGVSPSSLRGSNFRRIFHGVYIHASVPSHPLIRVKAALALHPPDAFASHFSAARVYGLPIPTAPTEHISVFAPADRRRRSGIRNHVAPPTAQVVVVNELRVSAPNQLFIQLAEALSLVDLVVVGDALVRLRRTTPEGLRAACAESRDPAAAGARRAACLVRADVDSPMETRLRMLLVLAGLPEPVVNHVLYEGGRVKYRFDLSYPELKLVVEYDGQQHRADLDQWDHDNTRNDWLMHHGWVIVQVVSRGIYRRPEETIERVRRALKARGCRTLPRVLSDDWRPYFPVRAA